MKRYYVDGSCLANGKSENSGGHAIVEIEANKVTDCWAFREENTTNNRQELKAILWVLRNKGGTDFGETPIIYSDSSYCVNTLNEWIYGWARKGWLKANRQPPENLDLIKEFYNLFQQGYKMDLRKVKGHAGEIGNELADELATGRTTVEEVKEKYGKQETV